TAIPEDELAVALLDRDRQVLLVLAAALCAGLALAGSVARRTARPLEVLADTAERAGRLDLSPPAGRPSAWREIEALQEAHGRMCAALGSFACYVPTGLVRQLLRRGGAAKLGGHSATLTVLFTDLEDFTRFAEERPAAQVAQDLSEYLSVLVGALQEHGATIDKFIGDSVLAFWGAPEPAADHARQGVMAVLAAEDRLRGLNAARAAAGRPAWVTRYGLATGPVVVGNFGTASRMNYTVLGNVVNVASRLEALNKRFGSRILATAAVRAAAGEGFAWQRLGPVLVKGRTRPEEVVELLGRMDEVPAARRDFARRCEAVLAAFETGDAAAAAELESLATAAPGDARLAFLAEMRRRGAPEAGGRHPAS
ncbi:MAG TPA: adenylate/guanylate cyclase domain-containing protein, partial [Verrucomicrobiota bacterium]|nr:adenylate/guanylate cyclase domain-containing protein [Verrucomicrobiota bacterium]